ncbi:phosphatidylethanolamine-binding protein [Crepidotus variabilis]|uniref:Phosphatidylethanolamine-binding protein n=1 Tax=Crepidotus variabilis TaxID=179855 RepID=A0A9P6JUE4_9AGAR|nr:phosphatidylethanolamine-binding protein [Crepidotus variabilis]
MFTPSVAVALFFVPFALAQDNSLGVQAIEAHFTQSLLVPDLLSSFTPSSLLTVNFAGVGELQPGQALVKEQSAPYPTVKVTPGNSSVTLNGTYTLAMVDAEAPGSKLPEGQTRHWLVNGVKISGNDISNSSAVAVTDYAGPGPAAGSGVHRYVVVLYEQPANFSPPEALSKPGVPVQPFVFSDYVKNSNLGPLVAATYFTVQEGTATVSAVPTSSVISSTLKPAGSSTSKGASGTGSASAPGSSSSNGASTLTVPAAATLFGMLFALVM